MGYRLLHIPTLTKWGFIQQEARANLDEFNAQIKSYSYCNCIRLYINNTFLFGYEFTLSSGAIPITASRNEFTVVEDDGTVVYKNYKD